MTDIVRPVTNNTKHYFIFQVINLSEYTTVVQLVLHLLLRVQNPDKVFLEQQNSQQLIISILTEVRNCLLITVTGNISITILEAFC